MSRPTKFLMLAAVLLLVTGGTATAAKLITGKQVKNSSLTGADLKNGSVGTADLSTAAKKAMTGKPGPPGAAGPAGPAGPQGPAGTPDGYTKGEADARFLGAAAKAADADKVDGVDGDDLVGGDAKVGWNVLTRGPDTAEVQLIQLGDLGELRATCGAGGAKAISFLNESFESVTLQATTVREGDTTIIGTAAPAANVEQSIQNQTVDYSLTVQVARTPAAPGASKDFSTAIVTATDDGSSCRFHVQTIDNETDGPGDILAP